VSREWKRGDVALRTSANSDPYTMRSMTALTCGSPGHDAGLHWHHENGGWDPIEGRPTFRPLVVIDPEDREQVKRLDIALSAMSFSARNCGSFSVLQAALREFADPTPPKPAEPTGLGAVVECSDGRVFVVDHVHSDGTPRWYGPDVPGGDAYSRPAWSTIPAVRVLSEGVS